MTLVEEYYELNEAEEVPVVWKILQIGFYGTSAGLGLWCGFTLATLRLKFGDRCYLFTTLRNLSTVSELAWESDTLCDYYQFSFVSSFIVGVIWAALFLMCGKGGKSLTGLPQPWRIIWPSLFFNIIFFLATLGTSIKIQEGTNNFCKLQGTDKDICTPLPMLIKKPDIEMTNFQIRIVPKTAWGCTASWLILTLLSLFRIIFLVDFRMYKICVFKIDDTIQNRREEVLKVTNYEEPKRLNFSREILSRNNYGGIEDQRKVEARDISEREGSLNRKIKALNPSFQPNTAFYIMADKMLAKQRKSKIPGRAVDEGFDRNLPVDPRRVVGGQSKSNEFEYRPFFPKYSKHLYDNDEEEGISTSSTTQKNPFKEEFDKSASESEILVRNFGQNDSVMIKKLI